MMKELETKTVEHIIYGLCTLPVVPCRAEGNDRAEMVTQLLFGERYTILSRAEKWIQIKIDADGYEAWICHKQHTPISKTYYNQLSSVKPELVSNHHSSISSKDAGNMSLPVGSKLPNLNNQQFSLNEISYHYEQEIASLSFIQLKEYALSFLNAPYLWGGKTIFGIDCSGFSQVVFSLCGLQLPRDAYQQAALGTTVDFVANAKPGDLAFFDNSEGRITHVGIVIEEGKIIHASGKVRIDLLDHQGIYDQTTKTYTHTLRIVKRYFEE